MYVQYMCILLYVKLIWCNGIPYMYPIVILLYLMGGRCMGDAVYVHSAIYDTYLV